MFPRPAAPAAHWLSFALAAAALLSSPWSHARDVPVPTEELQRRLQERIAQVRSTHAQTQPSASTPAPASASVHARRSATATSLRRPAAPNTAHAAAMAQVSGMAAPGTHAVDGAPHAESHPAHWSYSGDGGPAEWGKLRPEFSACAKGQRQSPIDIRGGIRVDLEPIKFQYRPSGFNVVDNGHTVQANIGHGNSIEVGGRRYDLVQFHFHRPSEERINGKQFELVAHLVHKDPEGRLAVVAVLMDQGKQHPMVQLVWNSLPLEKNEEYPSAVPLDMNLMLPEDRRYYTYMGSLTTPPCSEGVLWLVLKQPAQLSAEQLAVFTRLYPMNARPIQQASGRMLKESN